MKILLIAGHGANDPGACSNYGVEREETRKVVARVREYFKDYDVSVDVYPTNRNCYDDVKNGTLQVNFKNYDYIFEIHFNSVGYSASGSEIWVVPEESGVGVETAVLSKICATGLRNRGVKREYLAVINYAKNRCGVSAALLETCFISEQSDMNLYRNKFEDICRGIVEGIADGFQIERKHNAEPAISVIYSAHVEGIGWQSDKRNGEVSGTVGQSRRLEALTVRLSDDSLNNQLNLQCHIQNIGDSSIVNGGQIIGTMGRGLRLESIKIDSPVKLLYRAHIENKGWSEWASSGNWCGTKGEGLRIEAIEIKIA